MERFNNWMTYSFDNGPMNGPKPAFDSIFKLHFKKGMEYKKMSYYDALFYNGSMIADNYTGPFDTLLSGGIDSEVMVRVFDQLGVKQKVHTIRLEDDINKRDVDAAIKIADDIGIKLHIIDWNLRKFIENGAVDLFNKTFSPIPGRMIRHAWLDFFDNIPVMGEGEPYWKRELGDDFSKKSEWKLHWEEDYFTASVYANTVNRLWISEWYNYTPEIVMNYHNLPLAKKLLNDEIPDRLSCWSSRTEIHRVLWPSIFDKPKLTGYEGVERLPGNVPDFMGEFWFNHVKGVSNQGYTFSVEELENIFK